LSSPDPGPGRNLSGMNRWTSQSMWTAFLYCFQSRFDLLIHAGQILPAKVPLNGSIQPLRLARGNGPPNIQSPDSARTITIRKPAKILQIFLLLKSPVCSFGTPKFNEKLPCGLSRVLFLQSWYRGWYGSFCLAMRPVISEDFLLWV